MIGDKREGGNGDGKGEQEEGMKKENQSHITVSIQNSCRFRLFHWWWKLENLYEDENCDSTSL